MIFPPAVAAGKPVTARVSGKSEEEKGLELQINNINEIRKNINDENL
jgi:hypothetical protein